MEVARHKATKFCENESDLCPFPRTKPDQHNKQTIKQRCLTQRHKSHCLSNVFVVQTRLHITLPPPRERNHTYLSLFSLLAVFPKTAVPLSQLTNHVFLLLPAGSGFHHLRHHPLLYNFPTDN